MKRSSGKAMPKSRLIAGPKSAECSSYMWTWSAAAVSRKRTVVASGVMGRRRLVARQQKKPTSADTPTMIVGGMPTLIFRAATKNAINPSAATWFTACARAEYISMVIPQ
jgi:hypothetical protein